MLSNSNKLIIYSILLGIFMVKCLDSFDPKDSFVQALAKGEKRKACSKVGLPRQPPNRFNSTSRLLELRKIMQNQLVVKKKPIDAYLVTSEDEHQTEYVAPYDQRLKYISGFSGSYGLAVITLNNATLWTDGRYHLQADEQINCDWLLMRMGYSMVPSIGDWLKLNLKPGNRIGADPKIISAELWGTLEYQLADVDIRMIEIEPNLIDVIWKGHEEEFIDKPVSIWDIQYAGISWTEKVTSVRKKLQEDKADSMVITALDEIAWLLNIRGRDVPFNPFVRSYVILAQTEIYMYVNRTKLIKNNIVDYLDAALGKGNFSVQLKDYTEIWGDLPSLTLQWNTVLLPSRCTFTQGVSRKIYSLVKKEKRLLKPSPIIYLKAIKNKIERQGMAKAHIRDAAAMCEFMAYFETRMDAGDQWDELQVANELNRIRYEQINCSGNSFPTVVAYGSNGAQPHYEPSKTTNKIIEFDSTLVLDSGGQYYEGTTDVTRTIHLGEPTDLMKDAYTRVLIGTINYAMLTFPSNTNPSVTDVLARAALWEAGLDYLHSTGHGIGTFSSSHEAPISISYQSTDENLLQEGYFFTNEPGYYNLFGVRLENVLEVINKRWLQQLDSGEQFFGFDVLTLVPYEPKLINSSLLSAQQIRWLNKYNAKIRHLVGYELKLRNKTEAFYWMMRKTEPVPGSGNKNVAFIGIIFLAIISLLIT